MDMKTYRFGVLGAGSMGKTIAAGANAITYTPPDSGTLLAGIMHAHRERYR